MCAKIHPKKKKNYHKADILHLQNPGMIPEICKQKKGASGLGYRLLINAPKVIEGEPCCSGKPPSTTTPDGPFLLSSWTQLMVNFCVDWLYYLRFLACIILYNPIDIQKCSRKTYRGNVFGAFAYLGNWITLCKYMQEFVLPPI